ncbi:LysR substrate-binding domain-containing protein [Streptomyces sp. NBC_00442]|uniref:LysR substrate-binding domain-containing protein n=1 Tax=Streptomyces sp. NBC_00442 TaxID=2903651 RepID=UPI002E237A8F
MSSAEVDLALTRHPMTSPHLATGPVLVCEARMLAVPTGHPFTRRRTVTAEDLARVTVLRVPESLPDSLREDIAPPRTPAGKPVTPGPVTATFNEALTLVGAGEGVFVVGAHVRRYFARPDVAYVNLEGAAPVEWGLVWPTGRRYRPGPGLQRGRHRRARGPRAGPLSGEGSRSGAAPGSVGRIPRALSWTIPRAAPGRVEATASPVPIAAEGCA